MCVNGTEILFNLKRARDLFKERQEGVKWNYFAICQQSSPHHTPTHSFVGVTVSVGEVFFPVKGKISVNMGIES